MEVAQKGVGRLVYNFISEGAEEVLSDLSDPLAKYITGVDKNVGENFGETFKGLPQTFLVGGSVGTVIGAGQDFLRSRSKDQQARGGSAAVRADFYIRTAMEQTENFGSVDDARVEAAILNGYKGASQQLAQMEPEKRAKYLESIGVHKLAFDDKGQLVAKAAENVNDDAVSPTLRAISGNLAHAPIGADVQISESAKTAKETVLKAIGKNANVVITDAIEGNNAVYNPDEDVIYISNGALDGSSFNNEDVARAVALHEVAHKAEGTAAYTAILDEVQKIYSDESAPAEVKEMIGDRVQRRKGLIEEYWDGALTREQNRYVVDTELVANMLGDLLGNSYFVERMGARNDGAWKRFVMALKAADMGKAAGVSKETQKYLSGLYKAYVKAVDDARQGVKVSAMVGEDKENEKDIDTIENERYNKVRNKRSKRKKGLYYSQYESLVMQWAFSSTTKPGDVNVFYNPQTNTWNKIVIDDTEDRYGTLLSIKDTPENAEAIRKLREEVYNEDYREEQGAGESVHADYERYWYLRGMHGDDNLYVEKSSPNGRTREIHREEPESERTRGSRKGAEDNRSARSSNTVKSDERKSKKKVYRRAEASATLEEAVAEHLVFSDAYAKLKGKSKDEATKMLWEALNTAEGEAAQKAAALRVADYVLDNAVVEAFGEDPNAEYYAKRLSVLKGYLRTLNLDDIKGEIRNRFGKDTSPYLLWGKREGEAGVAPDSIKNELIEQGIIITESNPAEIFFEIYDAYKEAKAGLERGAKILLKNGLATEERATLREEIAGDILRAYEEKGAETLNFNQFHKELASAERRAEFWKARYFDEVDKNHISNRLLEKARNAEFTFRKT